MDEKTEESAPKRSRSDENIVKDKDASLSSSSDSGHQSPHDSEQSASMLRSTNNNSNGNSNNSDSGLSCKMEDSSLGDVMKLKLKIPEDETETPAVTTAVSNKNEEVHDESMEEVEAAGEGDKPCSSASIIKRSKRNRSRNYRTAGRSSPSSSSSSSSSSTTSSETESARKTAETSQAAATGQAEDNDPEELEFPRDQTSSPASNRTFPIDGSPQRRANNVEDIAFALDGLSTPSSTSSEDDSDDDDTDYSPSLFDDRLSPDYASPDSADSTRVQEKNEQVNKILDKPKPSYTWNAVYELLRREHGLSGDGKTSLRNGITYGFNNRFYASRHVVERMQLSHVLRRHKGCVNCLNFNRGGDLLVTGSDDARLIIWDWAGNKVKHIWKSGHSANIFQSKFVSSSACLDIISAARDGRVRRSIVPAAGGKVQTSNLYNHRGPVHKLVISHDNPWEIISVGEDGFICSKDLREDNNKIDMLQVLSSTKKCRKVRLFSISHHPFAPEICVSGSDSFVRVYDKRSMKEPVHTMCPEHILESCTPNVTCCVYNNTGTEILASYSEENIYLFNNKNYVSGEYLHCYKGHYNQKTIKGVNFFGPNCEYVISGSDCGNIFYWDKNTEAILNFMPGDTAGVVNCLEPHPTTPILATSGLDHNIKIWTPSAEKHPPDLTKLPQCVRRNMRRTAIDEALHLDDSQLQYFIRQIMCRRRRNARDRIHNVNRAAPLGSDGSEIDDSDDGSSIADFQTNNDNDSDDDDEVSNLPSLNCGTQ